MIGACTHEPFILFQCNISLKISQISQKIFAAVFQLAVFYSKNNFACVYRQCSNYRRHHIPERSNRSRSLIEIEGEERILDRRIKWNFFLLIAFAALRVRILDSNSVNVNKKPTKMFIISSKNTKIFARAFGQQSIRDLLSRPFLGFRHRFATIDSRP